MISFFKKKLAFFKKKYLLFFPLFLSFSFEGHILAEELIIRKCDFYNNDNVADSKLRKSIGVERETVLDDSELINFKDQVTEFYESLGFLKAEVETDFERDEYGNVDLIFRIDEGPRARVASLNFAGNSKVSSRKLQKIIKTKKFNVFRNSFYSEERINKDIKRIKSFYDKNELGRCYQVDVSRMIYKNGKEVELTFRLVEDEFSYNTAETINLNENEDVGSLDQQIPEEDIKVKNMQAELANLSGLIEEKKQVENLLSGLLTEERAGKRVLEKELAKVKARVLSLESDLETERSDKEKLKTEIRELENSKGELSDSKNSANLRLHKINRLIDLKLKEIEKIKDTLGEIVIDTRDAISRELDRIELAQISVTKTKENDEKVTEKIIETDKETAVLDDLKEDEKSTGLEGNVLVVNQDLNFLVISLGVNKGAHKGMLFDVFSSSGKKKGKCRIIEVRKGVSAADVKQLDDEIKVGDRVKEIG